MTGFELGATGESHLRAPQLHLDAYWEMSSAPREPSPATYAREELLGPLWELYAASGYFNLAGKSASHFEELRRSFMALGQRANDLPHLFCQTVWPSERGVEASLSSVKPYRSSWMLHQLGRRPGRPAALLGAGQILRDTYLHTLRHSLEQSGLRWMFCYAESTVPWVARTHLQFAERMSGTGQALVMPLRLMDVECSELSGQAPEALSIGPATPREKVLLAWEIARTRPTCYINALDFSFDRLELRQASQPWHEAGLERERWILVARRHGAPLAALVLELGHTGANLFRLLDSARLFPLSPDGRSAYVALLDEARRWFSLRGRSAFVYLCEDDGSYAREARLHDAPETQPRLWIISARLVPDFMQHLREQSSGHPRDVAHLTT